MRFGFGRRVRRKQQLPLVNHQGTSLVIGATIVALTLIGDYVVPGTSLLP